jgi:cysteine-rich repeat protein
MGQICKSGACTATVCGDNLVEGAEVCDDGNLVDGDGCDADCTYSCVDPVADCPAPPLCQTNACNAQFVCTTNNIAADPGCMVPSTCVMGVCQAPLCGNGILELTEDCDFGGGNGANTGCEANCKFSCAMDADCADTNTCNGAETCGTVTVNGQMGRRCSAGTNLADCSPCTGGLCKTGSCMPSTCGDACIDMTTGEQCEPPNAGSCNAMCRTVLCGNGIREGGEQCDDSNTLNMDGCSSECKFEQLHRANWMAMQFATDTFCPANRLGSAIASAGQSTISQALTAGVADGSISILLHFIGLDDLSGTSDPGFEVGPINATPVMAPMGQTYNGASDLDWWYTVQALALDPNRLPKDRVAGSIAGKVLNAGPGSLTINLILGGSPASLKMSDTRLTATIGTVSTPLVSAGSTPGHLSSENLDPALQSFDTMAQPNNNAGGKLCGNVTAQSLNQVPVPAALLSGTTACVEGYTMTNTLLDVLIGGCRALGGFITVINVRQPDQQDPTVPNVGAGYPYTLLRDSTTKRVNGCRDMSGATVNLAACLADASYSAFFKFASDRVIGK